MNGGLCSDGVDHFACLSSKALPFIAPGEIIYATNGTGWSSGKFDGSKGNERFHLTTLTRDNLFAEQEAKDFV